MQKRFLSILLAVALCLSALSVAALAQMPEGDLSKNESVVRASPAPSSSAAEPVDPAFFINIEISGGGTVTTDYTVESPDTVVELTVTPNAGYKLSSLTAVTDTEIEVEVTAADGKYSFVMPHDHVTVFASFVPVNEFTDIDPNDPNYDSILYCLDNGIMGGVGNGKFLPEGAATRAEVVTVLWRWENHPETDYNMTFKDVSENKWYTEAVRWAVSVGIVNGYDGNVFRPNTFVTREQVATMLYRYARYKGMDVSKQAELTSFSDSSTVSKYATVPMKWAIAEKLMDKKGNDRIAPKDITKRDELAAVMYGFSKLS